MTSYGLPVSELLAKPTSVDHFGSAKTLLSLSLSLGKEFEYLRN